MHPAAADVLITGEFSEIAVVTKAGGVFGIITAFIAYYCGTCQLLTHENSYFTLPIGHVKKRVD